MKQKFRNVLSITSNEGIEIDAGALWLLNQDTGMLVLVDEDEYITSPITADFVEVEIV